MQRPFLANTEGLFRELRPGVRALRTGAPALADALEFGTPVLRPSGVSVATVMLRMRLLRRYASSNVTLPTLARTHSSSTCTSRR